MLSQRKCFRRSKRVHFPPKNVKIITVIVDNLCTHTWKLLVSYLQLGSLQNDQFLFFLTTVWPITIKKIHERRVLNPAILWMVTNHLHIDVFFFGLKICSVNVDLQVYVLPWASSNSFKFRGKKQIVSLLNWVTMVLTYKVKTIFLVVYCNG